MSNLSGKTTIVVGASRGLGHGIATAFAAAGASVVAVSRTAAALPERANGSATIQLEAGVGRPAVQAYAGRAGLSVEAFLRAQPFPMLSPDIAGTALVELAQTDADSVSLAYVLNGTGLHKVG